MSKTLHHIVIVGGGAGGLELATQLGERFGRKKKARITLVDQNLTHIWKPLLHEVAAGSLNSSEDELNYVAQAKWNRSLAELQQLLQQIGGKTEEIANQYVQSDKASAGRFV